LFAIIGDIMPSKNTNEKRFASDVLTLVGGTGIAQVVAIAVAPILSRIYSPSDFGILALFVSLSGILGAIACLRYEMSIMLPDSKKEADTQLILSIIVALLFSTITAIIFLLFKNPILQLFNAQELGNYVYLIPLFIFLQGMFLSLNFWNSRNKKFKNMSRARISASLSQAGTQIGAGGIGYVSGISLIIGSLVGKIFSVMTLIHSSLKKGVYFRQINLENLSAGIRRYKKFPIIDTWSTLLNSLSWQLPVLLLSAFFNSAIVGFYSLGFRLLQMPMSFIGSSISQVFYQRASESKKEGTLDVLAENVFRILVLIGLFPILILTLSGDAIFGVILGMEWVEAGVYVQILSIWGFIWFISSPLSTLYVVFEKQEFGLKYNTFNLITRALSLLIGGYLGNVYVALGLFAISGIFVYGYLCLKMLHYAGVKNSTAGKIVFSNFKLFIPAAIVLIILRLYSDNLYLITGVAIASCITYYLYILKTDTQLQSLMEILPMVPDSMKKKK
jgi:O-antigen/teichoic acid export membrane protein